MAFALPREQSLSQSLVCNSQHNVTHIGSSPPQSQKLTQSVVHCTEQLHASELHLHLLILSDTLSGRACIPPLQHRRWPRCVITPLNPNSDVPSPKIITVLGQAMRLQLVLAVHIWAAAPQVWHGAEHRLVAGQESPGLWRRAGYLLCPRGCEHGQGDKVTPLDTAARGAGISGHAALGHPAVSLGCLPGLQAALIAPLCYQGASWGRHRNAKDV